MQTTPLHPDFGVEVHGVDLRNVTETGLHPELRKLFERHTVLLFRDQYLSDAEQTVFSCLFGPLEDRSNIRMDGPPKISPVSNEDGAGGVYAADDMRLLNLQSNMLWHTDSTFLPTPALANILQARVVPDEGGATEFVSTRAGFRRLAPGMQDRLRQTFFRHRYGHSRARIHPDLAKQDVFAMWPPQRWRAVWTNPVTGEEALYIASHVDGVEGLEEAEGARLVETLIEAMTQRAHVYAHRWRSGDVIVWDERATMHRGTPWPYEQKRTLVSYCVSAREADGLASVRCNPR